MTDLSSNIILVIAVTSIATYLSRSLGVLFSERIDLSSFDKGVYILEISNSESALSEKIIIE